MENFSRRVRRIVDRGGGHVPRGTIVGAEVKTGNVPRGTKA
jgi:hypothetical protein